MSHAFLIYRLSRFSSYPGLLIPLNYKKAATSKQESNAHSLSSLRRKYYVGAPNFCRPIVQCQLPIRCYPPCEYSSPLDTVNRLKHDRLHSRHSVAVKFDDEFCLIKGSDVQLSNFPPASKPHLRRDKIVPALFERRHGHVHGNSAIPVLTGPRQVQSGAVHNFAQRLL